MEGEVRSNQEILNQELRFRMRQTKPSMFPRPIAPTAFITDESTAGELTAWLRAKEFSSRTIQILQGMDGAALFDLPPYEMKLHIGPDDGQRLYSQLQIQKSVCGYKTTRTKELGAILAVRRQRAEHSPPPDRLEPLYPPDYNEPYEELAYDNEESEATQGGSLSNALRQQRMRILNKQNGMS